MAKRLFDHTAQASVSNIDEELQSLRRRLGLYGDTVVNLKDNGFRTVADIRKFRSSPSFPSNMDIIKLLRDRTLIIDELMVVNPSNSPYQEKLQTAFTPNDRDSQDLRGFIQRRRNSIGTNMIKVSLSCLMITQRHLT